MGAQINPELIPDDIFVTGKPILPLTVANPLATGWDKLLDAAIGFGSAWGAVELDNQRTSNSYANAGAGYYRTANGTFAKIPTGPDGQPLPGYANTGALGNSNLLMIAAIVAVGLLVFKRV